jgi:amidase
LAIEAELAWTDAVGLAELVRSGKLDPTELVGAAIEGIEAVDPSLNAVIHRRFDAARNEAEEAAAHRPTGPLAGVPMLLKDLGGAMAGEPMHCGLGFAKAAGYRADRDSYIVEKLRGAGALVLGRTNVPELGTTVTTESIAYGPCRNPWSTDHTPGGSSGGSAAAVAAGMVPVAHASDGGGSIRIPASNCGIFGLKPSRGRVSPGPGPGESSWAGSTVQHVVTRTVRDSAVLLDVLSGEMPGDLFVAPPPGRPFASEVGADPGVLRIGWLDHPATEGYAGHRECAAAVHEAVRLLEECGHRLEEAHPMALGDADFHRHFIVLVATSVAAELDDWSALLGRTVSRDEYEPDNQTFAALGSSVPATTYLESQLWFETWRRGMASFWSHDGYDLLLTPVTAFPPALIGELSEPVLGQQRVIETLQYTAQFNVTGQPAMSVPLHWTDDGLPVGIQLVAGYGKEGLLLRVASQLEQAAPWGERRPRVHV